MKVLKLLCHPMSGHSHRAELMLSLLDLPLEKITVDLKNGEQKTTQFKKLNFLCQVPVLIDGTVSISDSNAILIYLATKYDESRRWLPEDPEKQALIQRFLSIAAGELVNGPATARAGKLLGKDVNYTGAVEVSIRLFNQLDEYLEKKEWLVGEHTTIADIALYAYIKMAPLGGIGMEMYSNILRWLENVENLNGFVPAPSMQPKPEKQTATS
ncbi:glutathione S-transferase [Teredinibacter sp. KSP-S5-2]|uniref:glutathione S-transferase n=1 Tax=Teredinibacter sp. KSP-S5-2 TaxID=3034506 RepID=UPI002934D41E|nr:glutathione S-transferase [Teredinibacter sp. KSP-S5-2]WNO10750.1 glutathione S-transferase [Teredinibacter sp. KSP-S5-2]